MKKLLFFLMLLFSLCLYADGITAISQQGEFVILYEDGTWNKKYDTYLLIEEAKRQQVLSEPELFKLAIREKENLLFEQYLKNYEDKNTKRTIEIIYNYILTNQNFLFGIPGSRRGITYSYNLDVKRIKELLIKGIILSKQNNLFFIVDEMYNSSNLIFYWLMALQYEREENYEKALTYLIELREKFIEFDETLNFGTYMEENTLEELDGIIYLMRLKMAN